MPTSQTKPQSGRRKGPHRAFTLIELLVVVGIIGILASLLLSTLSRAKNKAKQIQCQSRLRQLCLSSEMYRMDNRQRFMAWWWEYHLAPYAPSELVRHVPGVDSRFYAIFECTGPLRYYKSLKWSISTATFEGSSPTFTNIRWPVRFGYNRVGLGWIPNTEEGYSASDHSTGLWNLPESLVRTPSNCIQFGDSTELLRALPNSKVTPRPVSTGGRHGGRSVMAFVDGHVESGPWESWRRPTVEARRRWSHRNEHHPEMQLVARF